MPVMKRYKLRRGFTEIEIADVKINGRPLVSVMELGVGGKATLEFVAGITPDQRTIIGGFKSVAGLDSETEVVEHGGTGVAGARQKLGGWTSVSDVPAPAAYKPGLTKYSNITLKRG